VKLASLCAQLQTSRIQTYTWSTYCILGSDCCKKMCYN